MQSHYFPSHTTVLTFLYPKYHEWKENGQTWWAYLLWQAKRGNRMMNSIEMKSHFQIRISSGLNSPTCHWCLAGLSDRLSTYPHILWFLLSCYPTISIVSNLDTFLFLLNVLNVKCCGPRLMFSLLTPLCQVHTNDFKILVFYPHLPQNQVTLLSSELSNSLNISTSSFWWYLISSIKDGSSLKLITMHLLFHWKINPMLKRSRPSSTHGCVMIIVFRVCRAFLLNAPATMFVFPG